MLTSVLYYIQSYNALQNEIENELCVALLILIKEDNMANVKPGANHEVMRKRVLHAAARLFLHKGYTNSTLKEIANHAEINIGSLMNLFKTKEDILCDLVRYVLEGQFTVTGKLLEGITDDKILFYAAETTLQLHMAESSEHIRDIYAAAYSMPKSSEIIQHTITAKLEDIFSDHLPDLQTKDFYKLEIASGGIMRGFMTIPCNMWFTMDQKVASFLEATFLVYRVPDEKIKEAIAFVSKFDFPAIADQTIHNMIHVLEANLTES